VARIRTYHVFGFADFAVAVGTGLTFTLLPDPKMPAVAHLPFAVPHLTGSAMLRRATGLQEAARQPMSRDLGAV